jgi:predicted flap endonuclease-1-like 5' DNA nuclease
MKYSENKRAPSFGGWVIAAGAGVVAAAVAYVVGHFHYAPSGFIGFLIFLVVGLILGMYWGAPAAAPMPAVPAPKAEPVAAVVPAAVVAPVMAAPVVAAPVMAQAASAPVSVSGPAAMFTSAPPAAAPTALAAKPNTAKPAVKAASKPAAKPASKSSAKPAAVMAEAKPVVAKVPAKPKVAKAPKVAKPAGPVRLTGPRKGKADDLKEIEGIGPVLEKLCHSLGFYHFDQIAGWTDGDVALVDTEMKTFKGRIVRDKWVPQAKIIVTEGLEAFRIRAQTNNY